MNEFEEASQNGEPTDDVINFMSFDQFFAYDSFADIKDSVNNISLPKRPCFKKIYNFREKAITFLYSNLIRFSSTSKVTAIPISKTFLDNIIAILSNTKCVHHSHITGNIYGYAHIFCNERVRGNYFKIPVTTHNLFRFEFFFLIKRLRASVWKTKDIIIGGKNPTDISFAYIGNQVQFIDTIKVWAS